MGIRRRLIMVLGGVDPLQPKPSSLVNEQSRISMLQENIDVLEVARPDLRENDGPKLNLGSGWDLREGWVNVDMHERHKPDIVADATRLAPIEDNFAAYALAQDVLEHIHRDRVMTALKEWNRVLRMDGFLEIRTTDVIAITDLMRQPQRDNPESHNVLLRCMFGTQGYEGDFHLSGFTETWMRDALHKAGFEVVYLGRQDQWLLDVIARKVRHEAPDGLIVDGDDNAFLEAAYRRFLKRDVDDEGRTYWLAQLSGGIPREVVATILENTSE